MNRRKTRPEKKKSKVSGYALKTKSDYTTISIYHEAIFKCIFMGSYDMLCATLSLKRHVSTKIGGQDSGRGNLCQKKEEVGGLPPNIQALICGVGCSASH